MQKTEFCNISGEKINIYMYKAIIIGSGCAGLNCADTLSSLGCDEVALITNGLEMSTSLNTGSDKQTYYKLSTAGDEQDSVYDMAKTLFSGGGMQGYHSLTEAANSLKCFYKLVSLGVDFPKNSYGEYVGYRTDHDYRKRATSCGPLTSNFMAKALIKSVKSKKIDIFENKWASRLIVDNNTARGVICVDMHDGSVSVFFAPSIVLATGGPSGIYNSSVYPQCHNGSLGLALEAGCEGVNLTEWQYGIASTDFRWNLSGSYMQVIPRFVSIDHHGNEYDFLGDYLGDERYNLIFQKGYNWPFCPSKLVGENKSSLVDIAVYQETLKGRTVYLDFTKNESGYRAELLDDEAREYLRQCGVLELCTPIERLLAMNERAYRLYKDKASIDLKKQALKIDVCAQHCNGGISCDADYMTCIDGIYAIGECAGVFGVARPGGTALNSTQVSSMRAAEHIFEKNRTKITPNENDYQIINSFCQYCNELCTGEKSVKQLLDYKKQISCEFSKYASFIRISEKQDMLDAMLDKEISQFDQLQKIKDKTMLYLALINRDILISAKAVLAAMKKYDEQGFLSRGSFLMLKDFDSLSNIQSIACESDKETIIKIKYADGKASATGNTKAIGKSDEFGKSNEFGKAIAYLDKICPIPSSELWFEKVYNSYYSEN